MRPCLVSAALSIAACIAQVAPIYKDPAAPLEKRADDLLSRMTLEEKIAQLMNDSPAIERLGVPAYNWWSECLHGIGRSGRATVFPEPGASPGGANRFVHLKNGNRALYLLRGSGFQLSRFLQSGYPLDLTHLAKHLATTGCDGKRLD
jgi:hypothetical protein